MLIKNLKTSKIVVCDLIKERELYYMVKERETNNIKYLFKELYIILPEVPTAGACGRLKGDKNEK